MLMVHSWQPKDTLRKENMRIHCTLRNHRSFVVHSWQLWWYVPSLNCAKTMLIWLLDPLMATSNWDPALYTTSFCSEKAPRLHSWCRHLARQLQSGYPIGTAALATCFFLHAWSSFSSIKCDLNANVPSVLKMVYGVIDDLSCFLY